MTDWNAPILERVMNLFALVVALEPRAGKASGAAKAGWTHEHRRKTHEGPTPTLTPTGSGPAPDPGLGAGPGPGSGTGLSPG